MILPPLVFPGLSKTEHKGKQEAMTENYFSMFSNKIIEVQKKWEQEQKILKWKTKSDKQIYFVLAT